MTDQDLKSTLRESSTSLAGSPSHPPRVHRAREILTAVGRTYPHAWKIVDQFRAARGKSLPLWPEWCFSPLYGTYAIVSGRSTNMMACEQGFHAVILGAMAAWRVTQGIYRFDPALYEAVAETELDRALPREPLYRLPEWCVYIETPGLVWGIPARPVFGVWAHLDWTERVRGQPHDELRLLLDMARRPAEVFDPVHGCFPIRMILGSGTIADALDRAIVASEEVAKGIGLKLPDASGVSHTAAKLLWPIVSLVLYLCSEEPEIGGRTTRPRNPIHKRTKAGWRLFPADHPTTWDVGVRLGAALRRAHQRAQTGETSIDNMVRSSPRAHIRRAHWHTFVAGAGRSERLLKWLPPIGINIEDLDALPSVIHQVDDESH